MPDLTPAQEKALRTADSRGVVAQPPFMNGLVRANWERTMRRMSTTFVTPYAHGGYELTAAGKEFVYGSSCSSCGDFHKPPRDVHCDKRRVSP